MGECESCGVEVKRADHHLCYKCWKKQNPNDNKDAYAAQSRALGAANLRGQRGEEIVLQLTGGINTRLPYSDTDPLSLLQCDCVLNIDTEREIIISTTHTKPDSKGHSNENKFQLKLGEMWLLKTHRPNRRVVMVLTGREDQWLPWCLTAFKLFFDDAIFEWEPHFIDKIREAERNTTHRHSKFWNNEVRIRSQREKRAKSLIGTTIRPRFSRLRHNFFENQIPKIWGKYDDPNQISNEILRSCMIAASKRESKEWTHIRKTNPSGNSMESFWQCRTFFNPAEAAVALCLEKSRIPFKGNIARDIQIDSFMSALARKSESFPEFNRTKMSEDFVLKLEMEQNEHIIYVQSKSSGGGLVGHGKAIQNRAKEQIARNLLYRLRPIWKASELIGWQDVGTNFTWIAILDNNWALPKSNPEKNLRSLILAGYDRIYYADEMVDQNLNLNPYNRFISDLDERLQRFPKSANYVRPPDNLEISTEHDEAEHGEPGAFFFDY